MYIYIHVNVYKYSKYVYMSMYYIVYIEAFLFEVSFIRNLDCSDHFGRLVLCFSPFCVEVVLEELTS